MTAGFWRRFGALFGAGAVGVAALVPATVPLLREQLETLQPGSAPPLPVLALLAAVQPLILLAASAAVGASLAPKLGLRSHLALHASGSGGRWGELRASLPLAVGVGTAAALAILGLDLLTLPMLGPAGAALGLLEGRTLLGTLLGVLYGGVTEEILVRWGLMTLLAWAFWRLGPGRGDAPGAGAFRIALVLAALLFGAGHLPVVAASGIPLTPPIVARVVALNAVGGLAFGWLFWRRSLEAAMAAHATTHLAWSVAALLA